MEHEVNEGELKPAGAELLPDGRSGLRIHGWEIESRKYPILNSFNREQGSFLAVGFFSCVSRTLESNNEVLQYKNVLKLRVDGVLMRLRDTCMHCIFVDSRKPIILRENCLREAAFQALSSKGYPSDSAAYIVPSIINQRLLVILHKTQKLTFPD